MVGLVVYLRVGGCFVCGLMVGYGAYGCVARSGCVGFYLCL